MAGSPDKRGPPKRWTPQSSCSRVPELQTLHSLVAKDKNREKQQQQQHTKQTKTPRHLFVGERRDNSRKPPKGGNSCFIFFTPGPWLVPREHQQVQRLAGLGGAEGHAVVVVPGRQLGDQRDGLLGSVRPVDAVPREEDPGEK